MKTNVKNVLVLTNTVNQHKKSVATVIVYDYKNERAYYLTVNESKSNNYIPTSIKDFQDIKRGDLISIEVSDQDDDNCLLVYNLGTIKKHVSNVDLKRLIKKVLKVKTYRYGLLTRPLYSPAYLKYYMKTKAKKSLELVRIQNQKILIDKKNSKPKFLYKYENSKYYHLFIEESIPEEFINKNFSGYALIKYDKTTSTKRIISIIGTVKNDEETLKEKIWFEKENEKRELEMYVDPREAIRYDLESIEECLAIKYGKIEEVTNLVQYYNDLISKDADLFKYKNHITTIGEYLEENFGENPSIPEIIITLTCLSFRGEQYYDTIESVVGSEYESIDNRTLFQIHNDINLERNSTKLLEETNKLWGNFFLSSHDCYLGLEKKVYEFDNFDTIEFVTNYNMIDIETKLKLHPELSYNDLEEWRK